MATIHSRRRPRQNIGFIRLARKRLVGWLVCGLVATGGCSSLTGNLTSQDASEITPRGPKPIELTYRTDSGRLNQIAMGRSETQQVAFQQAAATPVPPFTTSTLLIQHPHPGGIHGFSQVTVTFRPRTGESESSTIWNSITGQSTETAVNATPVAEAWQIDIPDWQLSSLISQLKEMHYFRRVKVLGDDADIETNVDGNRFAKEFPAVPELDAMIVSIRREGRRVDLAGMAAGSPTVGPPFAMVPYGVAPTHRYTPPTGSYPIQRLPQVHGRP